MSAKHPSRLEVGGQGDRGAGHESGLDSDDDVAAAMSKAAARYNSCDVGGGKSVSPGAQSGGKRRASLPGAQSGGKRPPSSPGATWPHKPPALRGDPPIVLHDVSGLEQLQPTDPIQVLLEHQKHLTNEVMKMQDQLSRTQDMVLHLANELATHHGRPQIAKGMPPPHNPLTDGRIMPGAKDADPREMVPVEQGCLRRMMIQLSPLDITKRNGIRKIVHPTLLTTDVMPPLDLEHLPPKTQWKLWHYVSNERATLQTVLTDQELLACKKKGVSAPAHGAEGPPAPPLPLCESARRRGMAEQVRGAGMLKRVQEEEILADHHAQAQHEAVGSSSVSVPTRAALSPTTIAADAARGEGDGDSQVSNLFGSEAGSDFSWSQPQ